MARSWLNPVYDGDGVIGIGFGGENVFASSLDRRTMGAQSASEFLRQKRKSTFPDFSRRRSGSITFICPIFSCSLNLSPQVRP